uniref:Uncharacterized protein n=1 Tax=Anguilla anguilla TaxID=7936 RepID=A0A0E9WEM2_ANGAN
MSLSSTLSGLDTNLLWSQSYTGQSAWVVHNLPVQRLSLEYTVGLLGGEVSGGKELHLQISSPLGDRVGLRFVTMDTSSWLDQISGILD